MLHKSAMFDFSTCSDSRGKANIFLRESPPQKEMLCHHFRLLKCLCGWLTNTRK